VQEALPVRTFDEFRYLAQVRESKAARRVDRIEMPNLHKDSGIEYNHLRWLVRHKFFTRCTKALFPGILFKRIGKMVNL
jgi:hypothetical protein